MSPSGLMEAMWLDSRVSLHCLRAGALEHAASLFRERQTRRFSLLLLQAALPPGLGWGNPPQQRKRHTEGTPLRAADDSDGFMLGLLLLP